VCSSSFFTHFPSRPHTFRRRHRCHQRRRHRLCLPPTSTLFCLIVVYRRLSSFFVAALSLF
jgi:hypothetical protein